MGTSDEKPLTLRQQMQVVLELRLRRVSLQDTAKTSQATENLKKELARLSGVLARLDYSTRQRIMFVMIQEMDVLAYQIAVLAADVITEPMREQAREQHDERLLDEAVALFEELVG